MENINKETNVYRKISIYFKFKNNSPHQVVVHPPAGSIPLIRPPDLAVLSPWAEGLGGAISFTLPFFCCYSILYRQVGKTTATKKSRETL